MSWLSILTGFDFPVASEIREWRHPELLNRSARGGFLGRGTLMIERSSAAARKSTTLLSFTRDGPMPFDLTVQELPDGSYVLVHVFGGVVRHAVLSNPGELARASVRLSVSWDQQQDFGRFAVECTNQDGFRSIPTVPIAAMPKWLPVSPRTGCGRLKAADSVGLISLSNQIEPLGPVPSLAAGTWIATPSGPAPIERLRRGDEILTAEGKVMPLLYPVRRCVPASGQFKAIRLRAPFFGLSRDLIVAPHQRIVLRGSEVEYLFGTEEVLAESAHLVNGSCALMHECDGVITYHQLVLSGVENILANGCPVESFGIGRMRRSPERLSASVLRGVNHASLPEHAPAKGCALKPYEAVAIAQSRVA